MSDLQLSALQGHLFVEIGEWHLAFDGSIHQGGGVGSYYMLLTAPITLYLSRLSFFVPIIKLNMRYLTNGNPHASGARKI